MVSQQQLSLFDTVAVIKPTYKVSVLVKVKRKTAHAPLLKKGDIVRIEAIHPHNGCCKFWNELTESWGYLYPDEFVVLPPGEVDPPTPAEVAVGESNCLHSETDSVSSIDATIESSCQHSEIDSPTPAEVAVGESIAPLADSDCLDPISIYKPRGTARGEKDHFYYRLSYKEGNKVRQVHIRGGNTDSPISQAKVAEVRSLLAAGMSPRDVADMLKPPRL